METLDDQIRAAAFAWLREQVDLHGDVLPSRLLAEGFPFGGGRIPLFSPQGIFKPRQLDIPLSIRTSPSGPYDDDFNEDGFLLYKYRGTDPHHPDNRACGRPCSRASRSFTSSGSFRDGISSSGRSSSSETSRRR